MNKKLLLNNETALSFQGRNACKLYMYYENGELCFSIDNYDFNSTYMVTQDSELYVPIKKIFRQLKSVDNMRNLFSNKFEWVSEGQGIPEVQNRLDICEYKNAFILNFKKNRYNACDEKGVCSVHFALTNSKNKKITEIFNEMFIDLYNKKQLAKTKKLIMK